MIEPVYIVDEMAAVVERVLQFDSVKRCNVFYLNYMYGHPVEIMQRLQEMTNSGYDQMNKFPLVALFTDVPISKGISQNQYGSANCQMIIATMTEQTLRAPDRLETSFKPILYPIYYALLESIRRHPAFDFSYTQEIRHTHIDRFFWGKEGLYGGTGNVFNDYIDAIELRDLTIPIKNKICSPANNL